MTRNIIFKGRMGELFGEVHRLNVKTIQEAVHAIDTMKGGLKRYLVDCTENGVNFTVQRGEEFIGHEEVGLELGKDDIIISPIPAGAGLSDVIKVIIGIALIVGSFIIDPTGMTAANLLKLQAAMFTIGLNLALSGIIGLTMDDPDELNEEKSQMFNGPINNTKSGIPVPLCYGKMEVGGAVVNFGFTQTRIKSHTGYRFVSKSSSPNSGTYSPGSPIFGDNNYNWDAPVVEEAAE